jgi:colicin import membrane protein
MAATTSSPFASSERTSALSGSQDRLPKWLTLSFALHGILIGLMFAVSIMPSAHPPAPPVYVVDLIGGERIGKANLGTEIAPVPKQPAKQADVQEPVPEKIKAPEKTKEKEVVKEKSERVKVSEKKPPAEETAVLKEKSVKEKVKAEVTKVEKSDSSGEPSADSVRERLIQAAAERARARTESTATKQAKAEPLSAGSGEGDGAAALGAGGRGGPGIVKGLDFVIYQNRITSTIKANWVWVGQRADLKVVVQFGIKDNGEITGIKIIQGSGDATYDESVLRAVKKSSPLPSPPSVYRKDFSEVVYTFRPSDLGA